MRFWDSSAIVPLLVPERASARMRALYGADPIVITWWGTETECVSALCRRHRSGGLREDVFTDAFARLDALRAGWHEVDAHEEVREAARRLLRTHDLRAGDALQLAAALFAAESRPSTLPFVSLDDRLVEAARREGFPVPTPR